MTRERIGIVTRSPAENDHLPIYEDLVRERGDVVAAAQIAAAHTQNQATELLGPEELLAAAEPNRWDGPSGHQHQHQHQKPTGHQHQNQLPSAFG